MESQSDKQRQNIYSRVYISGRDITAFFTDCGSDCQSCTSVEPNSSNRSMVMSPGLEKFGNFYSLIDKCGMAVVVDQIKVPRLNYPSTHVSVQVPNLGIHFSPERYCRLMELLDILYVAMDPCGQPGGVDFQAGVTPWSAADLATDAKILVWRGIGNSVASWQPCFIVLSGFYLYVLESEKSQNYSRYLSMAGRQVHEVPSTNIGGSPFCIAVGSRGMDTKKALESSGTWVIEFRGEEEKITWLRGLIRATYQASAPPSVDILGETSDGISESDDPQTRNSKAADLVINGAVVETKLYIYGKTGEGVAEKLEEQLILEVLASGGKITVYFMELATPHTEEVIKLVDKVGDFECLVQKSEIDGTTALKLDLKLDSPIIIVPRNSLSREKRKMSGVYKNYDPRAKVIKNLAEEVFSVHFEKLDECIRYILDVGPVTIEFLFNRATRFPPEFFTCYLQSHV